MTRYMQFQAFIGPKFLPVSDSAHYPYYTALPLLDATIDLDYETAVSTSLASGAVTLVTTNSSPLYSAFPTAGGLWVGGNGASQGWEYIGFTGRSTNTFSGLVRESSVYRNHNGVHSPGAEVRFWYPIESDTDGLTFIDQLSPDFEARYWRMELGGYALPQSLLRNHHLVAIVYRTAASGAWKFFCLGVSDFNQIRDTYEREGKWMLYASSLHGIAETSKIHGIHVGDLNVAVNGRAFSSAPLGSAYKELLSGDYVAAEPDFSAASAIDGNKETLWISDYMVGTEVAVDATWNGVTQLYLNPHPGRGPAYKWIELTNYETSISVLKVYDPVADDVWELNFGDYSSLAEDFRVILTDDPVTFARENPAHEADLIIDVTDIDDYSQFMKHVNPAGGAIVISTMFGHDYPIIWGDADVGDVEDVFELDSDEWYGSAIDAPDYGQTIAFKHDYTLVGTEDSKNKWELRDYGTPGYMPSPDDYKAWLAVYLPGLGLSLRSDITSATTTIYVVDSSGEPSTEGLPSSGTIQIGTDSITFTGKTSDSLTGCSVNANHSQGDTIYVLENGVATDGFPITHVNLFRQGGTIYPENFYFRWSRILARLPTQSSHPEDYTSPYGGNYNATTGSTAEYLITMDDLTDPSVRCRTILIEFRLMTTEPACARLNELEVRVDTSVFSSEYFVDTPLADAGDVIVDMFELAGVPPGALLSSSSLGIERNFRTARDWAWTAIKDYADMHGLFVNIGRDAQVEVTDSAFFTTAVGGYSADYSWDEDDAMSVTVVSRATRGVSQVRVTWESPDGSDSGVDVYPTSATERGGIEDIGPYVVADSAAAVLLARKRYFMLRAPYYIVVEMADIDLSIEPGQFFEMSWTFPGETVAMSRLYVIAGVDLRVSEAEGAAMVVTGLQIDREVDW